MNATATPAHARRCRHSFLLPLLLLLGAGGAAADATPPCSTPGTGWCLARQLGGDARAGELGFRFGEPVDVDADGRPDIAAGARFTGDGVQQNGRAMLWSGADGRRLRMWDPAHPGGLFGHWALPLANLGADGVAGVVITAPNTAIDGVVRGLVTVRTARGDAPLWERNGAPGENFGWDLAPAGDQDGDRRADLFVGAPAATAGHAYLVSGRDGAILRTYAPAGEQAWFGWYVAGLDDLDGDGRSDLVVGSPAEVDGDGRAVGAAYVFSSAGGVPRLYWRGADAGGRFGEVVAAVADLDGDGKRDVAVAAPRTDDHTRSRPGEVVVYSSGSGAELRRWSGTQPGEQFGRMVVSVGDLNGDGVDDVAIGAPWFRRGEADRVGRVELRSGRSGAILGELSGADADAWFGWHIRRAPDPEGLGRPAMLVSALRQPVEGKPGVGVVELYLWRAP